MPIVAGVDFGTASVRVAIVHDASGRIGSASAHYPTIRSSHDPDLAMQRHTDHLRALEKAFGLALATAGIAGSAVDALAVATTGSTIVAVDQQMQPIGDYYLWCDHRAWREAAEITARAREQDLDALKWSGGVYSSEWGFAKLLHWMRNAPEKRSRYHSALEHCDLIVAMLCGFHNLSELTRSACAMGHKWMWNPQLGGLPPQDFLTSIDPLLRGVRESLSGRCCTSNQIAGGLCSEWADRLGLKIGIPIPVGGLDAHWDAIGAGCKIGDIVNVIGTSTCIMAVADEMRPIPGVSGVVHGSIHPHRFGIEAGLAAVGGLFEAIARRAGANLLELAVKVEKYRAGQTGMLRLAWDNGDRSVLANPHLRGATLGWRLNHSAADELFAAIEGTAFHTRIIIDRLAEHGVPVRRIVHAGGIPQKNETLNRVYASVLNKPILVPDSNATSLGSAIFAFLAAGHFGSVEEAQTALCAPCRDLEPQQDEADVYEDLFVDFKKLYFDLSAMRVSAIVGPSI